MELPISDHTISSLEFGYELGLVLTGHYWLTIISDFTLVSNSRSMLIVLESGISQLPDGVVDLVGRSVESAGADPSGRLQLRLSGDVQIDVPPDPDHEGWSVAGSRGYRVICLPGGELAEWDPQD